ncbi:MAG: hypothetical protein Q9186_004364 [Xanthomendoza sp. 1 TL-2023]
MTRHDNHLDCQIAELEKYVDWIFRPNWPTSRAREMFLNKVAFFTEAIPTTTSHGCGFADRVYIVCYRVQKLFSEISLQPLRDYAEKQSQMMIETANLQMDEASLMHEAAIIENDEKENLQVRPPITFSCTSRILSLRRAYWSLDTQIEYPTSARALIVINTHQDHCLVSPKSPSPTPSSSFLSSPPSSPHSTSSPFRVPITFINTPNRTHCTKEGFSAFILTFNEGTNHFDILDEAHHISYFLYSFHPFNLKVVAWAPGSLDVHTQTKDYDKESGKGEYMNLRVHTVEDLEELVEGLKDKGVPSRVFEL